MTDRRYRQPLPLGAAESFALRLETALSRADVYSAAGRFREEKEIYDGWRAAVLEQQDDLLTARLLALASFLDSVDDTRSANSVSNTTPTRSASL